MERAKRLSQRYGVYPAKATARIRHCVSELQKFDCRPTFFVPAIVVRRNLRFIRELNERGCEIGVHGYQHLDLKSYTAGEASAQLLRAATSFEKFGLEVNGFRCPYLSVTDELLAELPHGTFKYSSNKAVEWPYKNRPADDGRVVFETIQEFYQGVPAESHMSLPWKQDGMVEIPVSVPDDLQLHDGLGYSLEEIAGAWSDLLGRTHQRGELFNLMFHPELANLVEAPFITTLREARNMEGGVWVAQLRDISEWWLEKDAYKIEIERQGDGFVLNFICGPRGTVLYRGFEIPQLSTSWDATYRRLYARHVTIEGRPLPLIQVAPDVPGWVSACLKQLGYITLTPEDGIDCSIHIEPAMVEQHNNPVALRAAIESLDAPLIRFWPWPDGQRSALCLTGDLDALSLADYATRLLPT